MRLGFRVLAVAALAPLAVAAGLLGTSGASADTPPTLTLSNADGAAALGDAVLAPGDTSTVSGAGFTPAATVRIAPPSGYGSALTVHVGANGRFTAHYTVPDEAKSGSVTMLAIEQDRVTGTPSAAAGDGALNSQLVVPSLASANYTVIPDPVGVHAAGSGVVEPLGSTGLAYTGADVVTPLVLAAALLAVGLLLLYLGSKPRLTSTPVAGRN